MRCFLFRALNRKKSVTAFIFPLQLPPLPILLLPSCATVLLPPRKEFGVATGMVIHFGCTHLQMVSACNHPHLPLINASSSALGLHDSSSLLVAGSLIDLFQICFWSVGILVLFSYAICICLIWSLVFGFRLAVWMAQPCSIPWPCLSGCLLQLIM